MTRTDDCPFCQLVGDSRSRSNWISDFPNSVAILHFNQVFRGRSILITRNHYEDMLEIPEEEWRAINEELKQLAQGIARVAPEPDELRQLWERCAASALAHLPAICWRSDVGWATGTGSAGREVGGCGL